jgi:hypothetical protein
MGASGEEGREAAAGTMPACLLWLGGRPLAHLLMLLVQLLPGSSTAWQLLCWLTASHFRATTCAHCARPSPSFCRTPPSNFDYLMHLNREAGRSFKDLSQYPVGGGWVGSPHTTPPQVAACTYCIAASKARLMPHPPLRVCVTC